MVLKREDIRFPVTLFYDGSCPLCMREINHLSRMNRNNRLKLIDIKGKDFTQNYPELDSTELDRLLHAKLGDGRLVSGVDATLAAWEAAGAGWFIAPLRWPGVACIADAGYHIFARNRHGISKVLGPFLGAAVGKNPCNDR